MVTSQKVGTLASSHSVLVHVYFLSWEFKREVKEQLEIYRYTHIMVKYELDQSEVFFLNYSLHICAFLPSVRYELLMSGVDLK